MAKSPEELAEVKEARELLQAIYDHLTYAGIDHNNTVIYHIAFKADETCRAKYGSTLTESIKSCISHLRYPIDTIEPSAPELNPAVQAMKELLDVAPLKASRCSKISVDDGKTEISFNNFIPLAYGNCEEIKPLYKSVLNSEFGRGGIVDEFTKPRYEEDDDHESDTAHD